MNVYRWWRIGDDEDDGTFGPKRSEMRFTPPLGTITIECPVPLTVMDLDADEVGRGEER